MQAVTHYQDAKIIGEVSKGLGEAMVRMLPIYQVIRPMRHLALLGACKLRRGQSLQGH